MSVPVDRDDSALTNDEYCRGVLILTIKASDNGTSSLSDTATVCIKYFKITLLFKDVVGLD